MAIHKSAGNGIPQRSGAPGGDIYWKPGRGGKILSLRDTTSSIPDQEKEKMISGTSNELVKAAEKRERHAEAERAKQERALKQDQRVIDEAVKRLSKQLQSFVKEKLVRAKKEKYNLTSDAMADLIAIRVKEEDAATLEAVYKKLESKGRRGRNRVQNLLHFALAQVDGSLQKPDRSKSDKDLHQA